MDYLPFSHSLTRIAIPAHFLFHGCMFSVALTSDGISFAIKKPRKTAQVNASQIVYDGNGNPFFQIVDRTTLAA